MTNQESENVSHKTIDSSGNVINKPYGVSRWSNPRIYACRHEGCDIPSTHLEISTSNPHNCCGTHQEDE